MRRKVLLGVDSMHGNNLLRAPIIDSFRAWKSPILLPLSLDIFPDVVIQDPVLVSDTLIKTGVVTYIFC